MPHKDPVIRKAYKKKYNASYKKKYYEEHKEKILAQARVHYLETREAMLLRQSVNYKKNLSNYLFYAARHRAKEFGLPFTIEKADVVIPEFCPVLGVKLFSGDRDTSASIDRIIPELGYVKDNIEVISMRANRLKNNASIEEIEKILAWMKVKKSNAELKDLFCTGDTSPSNLAKLPL